MQVHIAAPYSLQKNLGKAYNDFMRLIPDDDYACLHDMDVCFLTPDAGQILHNYAVKFPDAALLTCYTNRVSALSKMQLLKGIIDTNVDYAKHVELAVKQKQFLYSSTRIHTDFSGMLMLISKKHWQEMPFEENGQCLGVDTLHARRLKEAGKEVLRMNGLYCLHIYRITNGVHNKKHLELC